MTCSFRRRISCERGPGTAVRSSIAFVAAITAQDNAAGGRSAYLYSDLSDVSRNSPWTRRELSAWCLLEGLRRKRFDRVRAGCVPEHEAFDVLEASRLDLILDV